MWAVVFLYCLTHPLPRVAFPFRLALFGSSAVPSEVFHWFPENESNAYPKINILLDVYLSCFFHTSFFQGLTCHLIFRIHVQQPLFKVLTLFLVINLSCPPLLRFIKMSLSNMRVEQWNLCCSEMPVVFQRHVFSACRQMSHYWVFSRGWFLVASMAFISVLIAAVIRCSKLFLFANDKQNISCLSKILFICFFVGWRTFKIDLPFIQIFCRSLVKFRYRDSEVKFKKKKKTKFNADFNMKCCL